MTVAAVILDIGNVLLEWHPEAYYDRTIGPVRRRAMFAEVDLHAMNERVDMGEDFRATIHDTAERNPAWRAEIIAWHDNWLELASPVIPRSVRLMRALRTRSMPVFALSNFGIDSFALARSAYDFLNDFDRSYVSGHMAVIKPDPRIYAMVESDCALPPARLLFTDDRAANIEAAAARGWKTHHFDGPSGWADRLVAEGLLTLEEAQ